MNKNSQAVAKSRASKGVVSTSVYLSKEDRDLWDRAAKQAGMSKGAVLSAALRAYVDRAEPTNAELLAILAKRLG